MIETHDYTPTTSRQLVTTLVAAALITVVFFALAAAAHGAEARGAWLQAGEWGVATLVMLLLSYAFARLP